MGLTSFIFYFEALNLTFEVTDIRSHLKFTEKRKIWKVLRCKISAIAEDVMTSFKARFHWMRL